MWCTGLFPFLSRLIYQPTRPSPLCKARIPFSDLPPSSSSLPTVTPALNTLCRRPRLRLTITTKQLSACPHHLPCRLPRAKSQHTPFTFPFGSTGIVLSATLSSNSPSKQSPCSILNICLVRQGAPEKLACGSARNSPHVGLSRIARRPSHSLTLSLWRSYLVSITLIARTILVMRHRHSRTKTT